RFKRLFDVNDPTKGGSFYLQSKILRARERIELEVREAAEAAEREEVKKGWTPKVYKDRNGAGAELYPFPKLRPLKPSNMSAPLRAIHSPPSPSSSKKKISRFFPPWHPDVLAAHTSTSKSKPATSTSTTTQKPPPNDATHTTNNFTPITIITTITSITTVT
ncbi:MAG: hypothetical protein L6R42_011556, partial [Xanthoria sp. 1 TBL-2021]